MCIGANPKSRIPIDNSKQTITIRELNRDDTMFFRRNLDHTNNDYVSQSITKLEKILEHPSTLNKSIGEVFLEHLNDRIITVLSTPPPEDKFNIHELFNFLNPITTVVSCWMMAFKKTTIEKNITLRQRIPVLLFYYWLRDHIHGSSITTEVTNLSKFIKKYYIESRIWEYMTSASILHGLNNISVEKVQVSVP